jgi:protein subunit release factor B
MAQHEIKAVPDSYYTSKLTPIVLSEGQHVQISFEGKQVDNHADRKKNIKGKLVIKKKAKSGEVKNSAECEHPKSAAYAARPLAA